MSTFQPNDKVVCIDATPIPIYGLGYTLIDFNFPNGYIKEGSIYCVTEASTGSDGYGALRLAGKPVFLHDIEVEWNDQRFRKVEHQKQKASRSAKQKQPQRNTHGYPGRNNS